MGSETRDHRDAAVQASKRLERSRLAALSRALVERRRTAAARLASSLAETLFHDDAES